MRLLDVAFGHPRGPLGRLGAALMVRGNVEQETWAVENAQLHARSRVLVVGHGPGVGLVQAATAVAPGGHVTGVDPSPLMRELAAVRCAEQIAAGVVEVREGTAENTGCPDASVDAVLSVNNVMLWDRGLHRTRPGASPGWLARDHGASTRPRPSTRPAPGRRHCRRLHRPADQSEGPQAKQPCRRTVRTPSSRSRTATAWLQIDCRVSPGRVRAVARPLSLSRRVLR